ncbi:MAG: hypothetical protein ACREGK_01255 [Geminicoccales bacterium]
MAIDFDPYRAGDFDAPVRAWLPLTDAVNGLTHCMGQPDIDPFVPALTAMANCAWSTARITQEAPEAGRGRP